MLSLQRKIKSRITVMNTTEKAYEDVNKTDEEDFIATIEVIEISLRNFLVEIAK